MLQNIKLHQNKSMKKIGLMIFFDARSIFLEHHSLSITYLVILFGLKWAQRIGQFQKNYNFFGSAYIFIFFSFTANFSFTAPRVFVGYSRDKNMSQILSNYIQKIEGILDFGPFSGRFPKNRHKFGIENAIDVKFSHEQALIFEISYRSRNGSHRMIAIFSLYGPRTLEQIFCRFSVK